MSSTDVIHETWQRRYNHQIKRRLDGQVVGSITGGCGSQWALSNCGSALRHGLLALVCIGDTKAEYDAGRTAEVLEKQIRAALSHVGKTAHGNVIFAYEPVWSIGEGGVPADPDFANEQHKRIKAVTAIEAGKELPVLYGGSVNPQNCCDLARQSHIDGLFIGRSAWNAAGFIGIIKAVTSALGGKS